MSEIFACPFCRQLFARGEVEVCPDCDLRVKPLAELPPSHDADVLDPEDVTPPEDELKPWLYFARGRGPLLMLAIAGAAVFFVPWYHEHTPEIQTWTGFEFAKELAWIWAGGIGWFIMLPLVASRRTIRQMRGARVAVGFLAATVLLTVVTRVLLTPTPTRWITLRYAWGWGLYAAGFLAFLALVFAARFGGSLEDMPTHQQRRGSETLH